MDEKEFDKVKRNAEFLAEHELNDDAFERLIEGKFKRARAYQLALSKREVELVEQD